MGTTAGNVQTGRPQPRRSVLAQQGITTLLRLGPDIAVIIPRHFVRQLGLVPGQLVAWSDVGEARLLVRRAEVLVHGSGEVR